jgi:G6PDH family F420-dependent oxidoreductase
MAPAVGYFLSSEEHGPRELVEFARMGEEAGFDRALISDHYHPWTDAQGQSPFVWGVIGAIAATTDLHVTTGVTCPTVRAHPAVVAQAAATASLLLSGRFALGVGSGEALNEHITGARWPSGDVRLDMLEEAIGILRELWTGDFVTHRGTHYTVEQARVYSKPDAPLPIYVSGFGPQAVRLAARVGDGYVNVAPQGELVEQYRSAGGRGPAIAATKVCWGRDEAEARRLAHRLWKTTGVPGELNQELPLPRHFEEASQLVTEEMIGEAVPCGPEPEVHIEALRKHFEAGYDIVYVSQIGKDQRGFLDFFFKEVAPKLSL